MADHEQHNLKRYSFLTDFANIMSLGVAQKNLTIETFSWGKCAPTFLGRVTKSKFRPCLL